MGKKNRKLNARSKSGKPDSTAAPQTASKPTQTSPRAAKPEAKSAQAPKPWHGLANVKRRTLLKSTAAIGALIGGGMFIHAYDKKSRALHDLASIGNGEPAVVQVHDPSCALCRRLKANTLEALTQVEGVQYRIADLTSNKGRELAAQYGVGKVTLLLFDGRGKHVHTVQGVTPVAALLETFSRRLGLHS